MVTGLSWSASGAAVGVERRLHVLGRDASAYADEQLAAQRIGHAGLAQDVADHVGLAGEEDNLGLPCGGQIVRLDDLDGGVVAQRRPDPLRALGAPHAGDEARGQGRQQLLGGRRDARRRRRGQRLGRVRLGQGGEDAVQDGDAHGA